MAPPTPHRRSIDAADRARPTAPSVFTTTPLPHSQRLEAWNAHFRSLNAIAVADPAGSPLTVHNETWLLGGMLFSANAMTAARFTRDRRQALRDGLDHWVIRLMRQGRNQMRIGEGCHSAGPGELLLFRLDQGWIGDWTDAEWVSLCVPRDTFPEITAGLAALGPGRLAGPGAPLLADYMLMLERHLRQGTPDRMPALIEATRAMLSACLLRNVAPRAVTEETLGIAQLERVRRVVRQHIASPTLDAERVARMVGMSRSALYRLMQPHGGVAHYIQSLRLRVGHALLSDPALAGLSIAALAERVGFFDASAFSRAFRAQFGYAPREARAGAVAGVKLPGAGAAGLADGTGEDFGSLLRRITLGAAPVSGGAARARAP